MEEKLSDQAIIMVDKKKISLGNFSKGVIKLLLGNVIAQSIGIIAIPFITRVFDAETYGIYAVFLSIAMIAIPLSGFCYQTAIMMPKGEYKALSVLFLCFICLILSSSCLYIICKLWGDLIIYNLIRVPSLIKFIDLLPLVVFLHGAYFILYFWELRKRHFGYLSMSRGLESISHRGFVVCAGFIGWNTALVLILGKIISGIIALFTLIRSSFKNRSPILLNDLKKINPLWALKKYKKFAIFNIPSALLICSMSQLPTIIISFFYSPIIAGLYAIANSTVNIPSRVLGDSLSMMYLQHAVEHKENISKLRSNSLELLNALFPFFLIPFVAVGIMGKEVFSIIFGAKWGEAGVYIQIFSLFAFSSFFARILSPIFDVFDKQDVQFKFQIVNFLTRIGILIVGGLYTNIIICLIMYSLVATILNLFLVNLLLYYLAIPKTSTFKMFVNHFIKAIPFGSAIYFIKLYSSKQITLLLFFFSIIIIWVYIVVMSNSLLKRNIGYLFKKQRINF